MAVYNVTAPDGTKLRLEGPADATPEQIGKAAKAAYVVRSQTSGASKFEQARTSYTQYGGGEATPVGIEPTLVTPREGTPTGLGAGAGQVVEETTAEGLLGAITRGVAPAALGAAGGGLLGGVIGGLAGGPLGIVPGAVQGAELGGAAMTLGQLPIAPLVDLANRALGTNIQQPTQALEALLTSAGVAEPRSAAERIVQMTAGGAGGAATAARAGGAIARTATSSLAREVATGLSAEQGAQVVSGAAGGLGSQIAAELGAGPITQMAAGIIAGGAGMAAGRRLAPSPMTVAEQAVGFRGVPENAPISSAEAETLADKIVDLGRSQRGEITSKDAETLADKIVSMGRTQRGEITSKEAETLASKVIDLGRAARGEVTSAEAEALADKVILMARRARAPKPPSLPAEAAAEAAQAPQVQPATQPSAAAPQAAAAPAARYVEPAALAAKMEEAAKLGEPGANARTWLRTLANQDEEAMVAAQKLGVELPPDVFARQSQIREVAGLERSQKGSVASAVWRDTAADAATKLDEQLGALGAKFTPEGPAVTQVGEEVRATLTKKIDELASQAETAYAQIREQVPEDARGSAGDTLSFIAKRAEPREATPGAAKSASSPFEQKVRNALTPTREKVYEPLTMQRSTRDIFPTYATIDDLRKEAGRGLQGQGPFKDEASGVLKALYKTLTDDQERISSRYNTADLWKQAKGVVYERKTLEDAALTAFGSEMKNSIAPALRAAVKGDPNAITKILPVLNAVPEQLRRETFLTSIADASRATSGRLKGEFGVSQFPDVWRALRRSKDFPEIAKSLGKDVVQTLDAMFKVSKVVSQASNELTGTGASLQKVVNERNAAGLMEKLFTSNIGRFVGGMTAPGRALTDFLEGSRQKHIDATIGVFRSQEMEEVMREIGRSGEPTPGTTRKFITSAAFSRFAQESGIPRGIKQREVWLREALRESRQQDQTTEEQPTP